MNAKTKFILVMQLILLALYNLAHPVTPTLLHIIEAPVYVFGILLAIMSFMQLFFAPVWGNLSDRYGRRIMWLGPFGYAFGQLLFAFATTPGLLFLARAIAGIFAVITFSVNMAYLADQTKPEQRGQAMTLLAMMTALGTSVGYFIGGQLGNLNYQYPFFFQFGAGIVIAIVLYSVTRNERGTGRVRTQTKANLVAQWQYVWQNYRHTPLIPLLALTFFGVLAYVAYNGSIPYYLTAQYGADAGSVGNFVSAINLAAVAVNFGLLPILKRYLPDALTLIGAISVSLVMIIGILIPTHLQFFFVLGAFYVAGYTLMLAMTQALISNLATSDQGTVMGVRQSFQASGQVIGSLASGALFAVNIYFPFILTLGALVIALVMSIIIGLRKE